MEEMSDLDDMVGHGDQDPWVDEDDHGSDKSNGIGVANVPVSGTARVHSGATDQKLWGPHIPDTLQIVVVTSNGVFCRWI